MTKVNFRIYKRKKNNGKGTKEKPLYDLYWEKYNQIYIRYGIALTKIGYKVDFKDWSLTTNLLKTSHEPEEPTKAQLIKGYKPLSKTVLAVIEALIIRMDGEMPKQIKRDSKWLKSVVDTFHGKEVKPQGEKVFVDFLNEYVNMKGLYVAKGTYDKKKDPEEFKEEPIKYHEHPIVRRFKELDNGRTLKPNELTSQISTEFINKFKGDYLGNSLKLDLVAWKGALMLASEQGYKISNHKHWHLKKLVDDSETSPVVLTPDEIDTLFNLDCKNESLNNVRVLFLALYYSGQRYSDFTSNIERFKVCEKNYLTIKQQKTRNEVDVPIMARMREVFKQKPDVRAVHTPFFDRTIKKVCKMAGFDEPTISRLRKQKRKILVGQKKTTNYKDRDITLPKYEWIGSHTARRSTATNFEEILGRVLTMQITGHKSETTFIKYIGKRPKATIDKLKELGLI